ncbi:hypothetical protein J1N35_021928 [Gossypium stocksii]|uniref:Uncharacterized protein n=1 Tax=Gossypium stocksii TaxID=47602 RepID=A0A9D3VH65_9ROSI|nr:hypothetical protein J1N35_021928 [Gossypium stocksii]
MVISSAISVLNWLKTRSSFFVAIFSIGHAYTNDFTIIRIVKSARFAKPSYKRINSFLLIVGVKNQTDPDSKSYPGMEIPNRPVGQKPTTASLHTLTNQFANYGFGLMVGFALIATARVGNFTMGFGGLLSSLFNLHFYGFPYAIVYETTFAFPYAFNTVHGGHA